MNIASSKRQKSGHRVTEAKIITWEGSNLPLDQVATIESIGEILSQYQFDIV